MNIAILGAQGSGKSWLAASLRNARPNLSIAEFAQATDLGRFDLTLLMGLDLHRPASAEASLAVAGEVAQDTALRLHLAQSDTAFHSIYGQGAARLQAALNVIANFAGPVFAARPVESNAINNEPTHAALTGTSGTITTKTAKKWRFECDKCSDPDCERRLFGSLLSQGSLKVAGH